MYDDLKGNTQALRDRALFALGVTGGFRISEMLELRVRDVHRNRAIVGHVTVDQKKTRRKKRGHGLVGGKKRSVRVRPRARAALREWVKELRNCFWKEGYSVRDLYLFQSPVGGNRAITQEHACAVIKAAAERIGIVESKRLIGTHSMRKTYARRMYSFYQEEFRAGRSNVEPLVALQRDLGHSNIATTQAYISFIFQDVPDDVADLF